MPWNANIAVMGSFTPPPGVVTLDLATLTLVSSDFEPWSTTAYYIARLNGEIAKFTETSASSQTQTVGEWTTDSPLAGTAGKIDGVDYEIQVVFVSGVAVFDSGPALATWVTLDVERTWVFAKGAGTGVDVGNYRVDVRDVATSTLINSTTLEVRLTRTTR